jgi:methylated-DNA-[protein]-cysteine S-methyltransferase
MAYALHLATLQTPVGTIVLEGNRDALTAVRILGPDDRVPDGGCPPDSPVTVATDQLREYFAGTRQHFDIPLAPLPSMRGMALRQGMIDIAYGTTTTYGMLAQALHSAPRAIGQACRRNPFPIIVPCHRVTSTSGPEYYSGGNGATTKAWLIDFEHRTLPPSERTRLL